MAQEPAAVTSEDSLYGGRTGKRVRVPHLQAARRRASTESAATGSRGRGESADRIIDDARAVQAAGAFRSCWRRCPPTSQNG